jgi:hypothetical protein
MYYCKNCQIEVKADYLWKVRGRIFCSFECIYQYFGIKKEVSDGELRESLKYTKG